MKLNIYFMNNWNGYHSPNNWIRCIKHNKFVSGIIIGIYGFDHSMNDTTYKIVFFGFGICINIKKIK